jgi:DNA (cytosine-5)-methyltransferase 1
MAKVVNLKDYFRVKAAAEFLGVSSSTLRNWDNDGKLKSIRHPLNKYRLYRKQDLETFLENLKKNKQQP